MGRIGASVALDCDFIADPQPHIEWFIGELPKSHFCMLNVYLLFKERNINV